MHPGRRSNGDQGRRDALQRRPTFARRRRRATARFTENGYRVGGPRAQGSSPTASSSCSTPGRCRTSTTRSPGFAFFLLLGVLGGTVLALLAGLATAQRAMRPIVELSDAAREIERTRDPSRARLPTPRPTTRSRSWRERSRGCSARWTPRAPRPRRCSMRQREFVADASHELRTPLTSVLANLELLAEELEGEQADTAQAALRSTRRMRRLVGDLLLLARADASRVQPRRPTDLGGRPDRGRRGARADGRRSRADDRRRARRSCRGPRRPAPAGAQPARERGPPHAARARTCAASTAARGRRGDADRRGRRARDPARAAAAGCSSGSCAAAATAAAAPGSGWRSSARSPSRTAARVSLEPPPADGTGSDTVRRAAVRARRPRRGRPSRGSRTAQTSTTTGSTIGRRRSRS